MIKGTKVWTWFDTGAFGSAILEGTIIALGSKRALIEWESGNRNLVKLDRIGKGCAIQFRDTDLSQGE